MSVATEARLLRDGGHDVLQVLEPNPDQRLKSLVAIARAPYNSSVANRIDKLADEFGPDVAHVNNTWFAISPEIFHRLHDRGIPIVFTLRNYRVTCIQSLLFRDGRVCTDCVGHSPLAGVRHRCYRGSLALSAQVAATIGLARRRGTWKLASGVLALSESAKSILVQGGWDPRGIDVVPNGVLDPGPRLRPPSESRRLLYVGRLAEEKGAGTLLEAWRRLGERRRQLELVVIGDGPLRERLEQDLPPGASIIGWREPAAVREEMLGARGLLFPTECLEPFGRGVVEAFAAGLPVLGSEIGATTELVTQVGSGWTAPAAEPDAWADGIAGLVDGERVDDGGVRARDVYERCYSEPVALKRLEGAYAKAISRRSRQ